VAILVSGGAGFFGLNLIEAALRAGEEVVALSLEPLPDGARWRFDSLPGRCMTMIGDVRDEAAWRDACALAPIDTVIHGATITAGAAREAREARRIVDVNLGGTLTALAAASAQGVRRFVQLSSVAVYGTNAFLAGGPLDESGATAPDNLYGITKRTGEDLARRHGVLTGLDVVVVRLAALFGPWERDTGLRDTLSPPFQIARQAIAGEIPRLAPGAARDWLHAGDAARAVLTLAAAPAPRADLYVLGCGALWPLDRFARALAAVLPGFDWRDATPGETTTIDYAMPLDRTRRPATAARYEAEHGPLRAAGAADPCADYARWVADHRDVFEHAPSPNP